MFYADLVVDLTAFLESRCSTRVSHEWELGNFGVLQKLLAECGYTIKPSSTDETTELLLSKACPKDSTLSSTPAKSDTNPALHNEYMEDFN